MPAGQEQDKMMRNILSPFHCCNRTPNVRWNYVAKNFAQVSRQSRSVEYLGLMVAEGAFLGAN